MAKYECVKKCFTDRIYERGDIIDLPSGSKTPPHFVKIKSVPKKKEEDPPKTFKEINDKNIKDEAILYG